MKKVLLSILMILMCSLVYAQGGLGSGPGGSGSTSSGNANHELPEIVPQAPDVMAMQKYGEVPVGYYTGTPSINIPIYSVQTSSGVVVPLSVSYHASGIKVDEKASRVGLGWSLSAPGMISKSIVGIDDDSYPSEAFPNVLNFNPVYTSSHVQDYKYALRVAKGGDTPVGSSLVNSDADSGYDIYNYNFLGRSGKFIIDKNNNVHTIPYEPIKIEKGSGGIFTITDENGNVYEFKGLASNKITSSCTGASVSGSAEVGKYSQSTYLTKVITNKKEEIHLNYRHFSFEYIVGVDETSYFKSTTFYNAGCGSKSDKKCEKKSEHGEKVLSSIIYNKTKVEFLYSDDTSLPIKGSNIRKDFVGNHALRKVKVLYNNLVIKNFELEYDYFHTPNSGTEEDTYRLKLTNVIDNNHLTHSFNYNETINLPKRLSSSQDYWGFYNGKINSTLIPSMYYGAEYLPGANRNVDVNFTQANILKKITYPTKGHTNFEYENNDYYDPVTNQNIKIGGLRIKKVSTFDGENYLYNYYSYNVPGTTKSSGKKQGVPIFSKVYEYVKDPSNPNSLCKFIVRTNSSIYSLTSDLGKYAGYTNVTSRKESVISNNRTEYTFSNENLGLHTDPFRTITTHDTDYSYKNGKLIEQRDYNSENVLLSKEENEYSYNNDHSVNSSDSYGTDKIAAGLSVNVIKDEYFRHIGYVPAILDWNYYFVRSSWVQLTKKTRTIYNALGEQKTKQYFFYDNTVHSQLTRVEFENSRGEVLKTKTYYPDDIVNVSSLGHDNLTTTEKSAIDQLKKGAQYRISEAVQVETYKNNVLQSTQRTNYKNFNGLYLPQIVQSSKVNLALEDRVVFHKYDTKGNPVEVSKKDGTKIYYVWGYNQTQPIAKIEAYEGVISSAQQTAI
ncbi:hypothetical protein, partial [Tenacibaculum halocynthiae]|uniref:hypothetical protein n=1 Tax=Tenacibaculum halocynthiae TaxID=1254437 RepID=UPI003D6545D5